MRANKICPQCEKPVDFEMGFNDVDVFDQLGEDWHKECYEAFGKELTEEVGLQHFGILASEWDIPSTPEERASHWSSHKWKDESDLND